MGREIYYIINDMADAGRAVLPAMGPRSFIFDKEIEAELKKARVWTKFRDFHPFCQTIKLQVFTRDKTENQKLWRGLPHIVVQTSFKGIFALVRTEIVRLLGDLSVVFI